VQVPRESGKAQNRQRPAQLPSQQTPSTQKPLAHWTSPVQLCP
jgi:hypothetical protein